MSNEEKLEQLVRGKNWLDLTDEERKFVYQELGSEELFCNLQQVEINLRQRSDNIVPNKKSLQLLQSKFRNHHHKHSWVSNVMSFSMPAYASLSLVVLAVWIGWLVGNAFEKPAIVYQKITTTDTVYLASKPDTVFLTKIVYKSPASQPPVFTSVNDSNIAPVNNGVSMQEKELLNSFIVSGSE
jgi:hypothetical protein